MAACNGDTYGGYRAEELVGREVWLMGPGLDLPCVLVVAARGLSLADGRAGDLDVRLGDDTWSMVCTFPLGHFAIAQVYGSPELVEGW